MNILCTGSDGYIGYPTVLKLSKEFKDSRILAIDNKVKIEWLKGLENDGYLNLDHPSFGDLGLSQVEESDLDLTDPFSCIGKDSELGRIFWEFDPNLIIHTAAQPSAPYSQIDTEHCIQTQVGNMMMLLHLIWQARGKYIPIICLTTTGIPGAPPDVIPEEHTKCFGGSWYHQGRAFDSLNLWLAKKDFGQPYLEMRTGIVFGTRTKETNDAKVKLRFCYGSYFGTVVNRFIYQASSGEPITLYGEGGQRKPMIALQDVVDSIVNAIKKMRFSGEIVNQATQWPSIKELAHAISMPFGVEVTKIKNPRIENEEHDMKMENKKFLEILGRNPLLIGECVRDMVEDIKYGT